MDWACLAICFVLFCFSLLASLLFPSVSLTPGPVWETWNCHQPCFFLISIGGKWAKWHIQIIVALVLCVLPVCIGVRAAAMLEVPSAPALCHPGLAFSGAPLWLLHILSPTDEAPVSPSLAQFPVCSLPRICFWWRRRRVSCTFLSSGVGTWAMSHPWGATLRATQLRSWRTLRREGMQTLPGLHSWKGRR